MSFKIAGHRFRFTIFQIVAVAICLICLIVGIVAVVTQSRALTQYNEDMRQRNSEIAELQSQLSDLQENMTDMTTVDESTQLMNDAISAGTSVASLQTQYQSVNTKVDDTGLTNIANELDGFFGEDDKNARVPWFRSSKNNSDVYPWVFMHDLNFVGKQTDVLWLAYDGNGCVIAYAAGIYDGEKGAFVDVEHACTGYGTGNYMVPAESAIVSEEGGYRMFDKNGNLVDSEGNSYLGSLPQSMIDELNEAIAAREEALERQRQEEEEAARRAAEEEQQGTEDPAETEMPAGGIVSNYEEANIPE